MLSLDNTAKLLQDNPTLMRVCVPEMMEKNRRDVEAQYLVGRKGANR